MGLFKTKKETAKACCCAGSGAPERIAKAEMAKAAAGIKVLGTGCAKCAALEAAVRSALEELEMDAAIDHVTDGVMSPPALVVDGKVVSYGRVPGKDEAKALIRNARSR